MGTGFQTDGGHILFAFSNEGYYVFKEYLDQKCSDIGLLDYDEYGEPKPLKRADLPQFRENANAILERVGDSVMTGDWYPGDVDDPDMKGYVRGILEDILGQLDEDKIFQ